MVGPPSSSNEAANMSTTNLGKHRSAPPSPHEPWEWLLELRRLATRPLERFLQIEAASGIVLLAAAAGALVWANSPWAGSYERFWETELGLTLGTSDFVRSTRWLVNDGLMTIFFFVVGMEIRRETHQGELSEWRRAALPAVAAVGGMVVPALLYLAVAGGTATRSGWGIPMATDIAFAVGILALLGRRVPPALRVLLLALAVIDDLGAILVIALFYSAGIAWSGVAVAAAGVGCLFAFRAMGLRRPVAYVVPAVVVWIGIYSAGIHPTIAGVVVGLLTPVSHAKTLIHSLHGWVAFGVMPIFAVANAGVALGGVSLEPDASRATWGVVAGLLLGKPAGVLVASFVALRTGIAAFPAGIGFRHMVVLGIVAGIGFTMSLFVAGLAFGDDGLLSATKLGVLAASGAAMAVGLTLGRAVLEPAGADGAASTADEAEASTKQ